jgi:hypothetical protein
MTTTAATNLQSCLVPWRNGLRLRITKTIANATGMDANSPVRITVQPGRIIIAVVHKKSHFARDVGSL